jgi:hypothetical protein
MKSMNIAPQAPHGGFGERTGSVGAPPHAAIAGISMSGTATFTPHPKAPTSHRSHSTQATDDAAGGA